MRSFGERLQLAIKRRWSHPDGSPNVLQFQQAMKKASRQREEERPGGAVRGVSYPSILSYLNDQVRPPLDFIEAAAHVLGVRSVWLTFGEGEPTLEEEVASRNTPPAWVTRRKEAFERGFPGFASFPPWVQAEMTDPYLAFMEILGETPGTRPAGEGEAERAKRAEAQALPAEWLGRAYWAPIEELRLDSNPLDQKSLEFWFKGMSLLLSAFLRQNTPQQSAAHDHYIDTLRGVGRTDEPDEQESEN